MTRYEQLFEQYVKDLNEAKEFAECWWTDLQNHEHSRLGTSEDANRRLRRRWPNGPASHPRVLAVIRKYWLACEALNEAIVQRLDVEDAESEEVYILIPEGPTDIDESEDQEAEEEEEEIYPHLFILEWLLDGDHDELARFLGSLTYWPVGVDMNGRYT